MDVLGGFLFVLIYQQYYMITLPMLTFFQLFQSRIMTMGGQFYGSTNFSFPEDSFNSGVPIPS